MLSINFLPEGSIYRGLLSVNERIIAKRIRDIARRHKISRYTYINSFNVHYPNVARHLDPVLQVFHCVDPLVSEYDRRHGLISEEILVRQSQLIVCTSLALYEEKNKDHPAVRFIPNAADINHSSAALDPALPVHPALRELKKPIVGYFGNIEQRLDFDLIKFIVESHSDKSFVFAGPVSGEIPPWLTLKANVHLIGHVPYAQMPSVLKGLDICIIPFRRDDFSRTIFPLKLFEYLGAGKPVIATDFNPDLKFFTGACVSYCDSPHSFADAISAVLEGKTNWTMEEALAIAKANTWEKRGAEFSHLLKVSLDEKETKF